MGSFGTHGENDFIAKGSPHCGATVCIDLVSRPSSSLETTRIQLQEAAHTQRGAVIQFKSIKCFSGSHCEAPIDVSAQQP